MITQSASPNFIFRNCSIVEILHFRKQKIVTTCTMHIHIIRIIVAEAHLIVYIQVL
jgi:hypothetical protein